MIKKKSEIVISEDNEDEKVDFSPIAGERFPCPFCKCKSTHVYAINHTFPIEKGLPVRWGAVLDWLGREEIEEDELNDILRDWNHYQDDYRVECAKCGASIEGGTIGAAVRNWNHRSNPVAYIVSYSRKVDRHMTVPTIIAMFDSKEKADSFIEQYVEFYGDDPRCWIIDELRMNESYVIEEKKRD